VTGHAVCQVKGILPYLAARGNQKGPLFIFRDGKSLTHQHFSTALNGLLKQLHINEHYYNTHSFRIGAATTVRQANIPDTIIEMLGRWKSDTYQSYIKTPPQEYSRLSKCLTSGYH